MHIAVQHATKVTMRAQNGPPDVTFMGASMFLKDPSLSGKRVLVTAGASGIGLAIARGFLESGARVLVCDVDPKAIDAYVSFATVQTAMDFVMVVALNNAGDSNAAQFYCAVLGLAAVGG